MNKLTKNPYKSLLFYSVTKFSLLWFQGWFPQWAVDQGIATSLMDFLQYCRDKVKAMQRDHRQYQ